jgi:hypothetical protein
MAAVPGLFRPIPLPGFARQWAQPQEPPQQPPPLARLGPLTTGLGVPCTANVESCLRTFAAPHSGHETACSAFRTSSSKWDSHSMHAYS